MKKSAIRDGVNCLEKCLLDVKNWMWVNLLKLNDDKTEVIVLGTQQQLAKLGPLTLRVGDTEVTCIPCVWNLGVNFDAELKHTSHVNKLVSSSFHMLQTSHGLDITWTFQLPKSWSRHWSSVRLTTATAYSWEYLNTISKNSRRYKMQAVKWYTNWASMTMSHPFSKNCIGYP